MAQPKTMPTPLDPSEFPLMTGARLQMWEALEQNDNYYELLLAINQHATVLEDSSRFISGTRPAGRIIRRDRSCRRRMAILLCSIPRTLVGSVIRGTVAYDFLASNEPSPEHYSDTGAGTYVAGIAVRGRGGMFLNIEEIEKIVELLLRYCQCYDRYKAHGGSPVSASDKVDHAWARTVDHAWGRRPSKEPEKTRFIKSDHGYSSTKCLIKSFKSRCDPHRKDKRSAYIYQKQSPLMVGCSNGLSERMPEHDPESSSRLGSTTPTWALLLCLIKVGLNLVPEVVVVPMIHIWEPDDLPASEVLGSALASSYCFQDGFNIIAGGGQQFTKDADDPCLSASKKEVCHTNSFLLDNCAAVVRELNRRAQYVADARTVAKFPEQEVFVNPMHELSLEAQKLKLDMYKLSDKCRQAGELRSELERIVDHEYEAVEILGTTKKVLDLLLGRDDEPDVDDEEPIVEQIAI
ncbi:hypothetical protein BKA67DRAFT_533699 [Truncatella angustata]|uniref:Uncharacterized protein n=1 Tax=Truncatella angustata TaxID=152316 RepID=A0A9P8UV01_9PEZI|nr:uncharacterized protein BKA67DRAFT_533699 [Truncatella angustata]KAH6658552.1 hypothetical protein BKA67DRAFT_533699 [Truncatella angustata]